MLGINQYFVDLRQSYIQDRVSVAENSLTDLELEIARLDDRTIQEKQFMEYDDFLKSTKFKSLLYKVMQSELVLKLKPREFEENLQELMDKLHAYDLESEVMSLAEVRDLVQISGMILVPLWDLEQAFMLDQIKRKENFL